MKQASPDPGKLFPCQARARGAPGSGLPPRNAAPPGPGLGEAGVSAEDNFLVSDLTSTHPAAGAEAGSGARRGKAAGPRAGGWGFLGRSLPPPYFRHLTPSAKRACSPAAVAVPPQPPRRRLARRSERRGAEGSPRCHLPRARATLAAAGGPPRLPRPARAAPHGSRQPAPGPPPASQPRVHSAPTSRAVTGSPPSPSPRVPFGSLLPAPRRSLLLPPLPPPPSPPLRLLSTPDSGRGLAVSP